MVAGIVLVALGLKKTLAHVTDPLDVRPGDGAGGRVASLYLLAHVAFRLRNIGSLNRAATRGRRRHARVHPDRHERRGAGHRRHRHRALRRADRLRGDALRHRPGPDPPRQVPHRWPDRRRMRTTSRRSIAAAVIVAAVGSTGCLTGERPTLAEEPVTTGDPAVDDVLARLDAAARATFTADYALLTRFGDLQHAGHRRPGRPGAAVGDDRHDPLHHGRGDGGDVRPRHRRVLRHDRRGAGQRHAADPGLLLEQRGGPAAPRRRLARRGDDRIGRDDRRPAGDVRRGAGGEWRVDLLRPRQRAAGPPRRRRRRRST